MADEERIARRVKASPSPAGGSWGRGGGRLALLLFAAFASVKVAADGQPPAGPPSVTPAGASSSGAKPDDVVAVVNGVVITRAEHLDALTKQYGAEGLSRLIETVLLRQEAERCGVARNQQLEAEVQERIQEAVGSALLRRAREGGFRSVDEFARESERARSGSFGELRNRLAEQARFYVEPQVLVEKILRPRVQVNDDQIVAEYERQYGPKAIVRQIVVRTGAEAEALLNKLKAGADFSLLAMEQSVDPVSGARGGLMEPLPNRGALGRAAFALREGEVSNIVKTDEGYHILKLVRKIPGRNVKLEDVEHELRERVVRAEIERRIPELLAELRAKGKIEVREK